MPEGMHFPFNANIWLPTGSMPPAITGQPRQARGYFAVGRLNDGVTVEQARAELKTIGATLGRSVSGNEQGSLAARRSLRRTHSRPADLAALLGVARRGRVRAADRLLERRQPAPGQGRRTIERNERPCRGWRKPLADRPPVAHREHPAGIVAGVVGLLLSIVWIRWFGIEAQSVGIPYWMVFSMDWRTFAVLPGRVPGHRSRSSG